MCIAQWAKCPVLYIDHFLDTLSLENSYTAELLPSPDQAERQHRLAFDALCKAASDTLQWGLESNTMWNYKCVVVKSRLYSTFELDRLLQLARERGCETILIIEFRMKNEYRFRLRLEHKVESGRQKEWYKPRSWKDIEKANDDYRAADNWDLHLRRLLDTSDGLPRVTRLVLDPFDDLYLVPFAILSSRCQIIINFLLSGVEVGDDAVGNLFLEGRYAAVQFGEVGLYRREKADIRGPRSRKGREGRYEAVQFGEVVRYLRENNLRGPRRRKGLCYARDYFCIFKYWEELENDDQSNLDCCGVCEKHVISGHPAYACHFCTITLHKSCAERGDIITLDGYQDIEILRDYPNRLPWHHACKSCLEGGKNISHGCHSCKLQTHLKCRLLPTIVNHDSHKHHLFLYFDNMYKCNACGLDRSLFGGSYFCYICDKTYDIECLSQGRQGEHEHGGHRHLLKLMYSRDGMEEDESYWCDICYEDIDPQNWFYSCQDCPYFEAHPNCARHSIRRSLQTHPKDREK